MGVGDRRGKRRTGKFVALLFGRCCCCCQIPCPFVIAPTSSLSLQPLSGDEKKGVKMVADQVFPRVFIKALFRSLLTSRKGELSPLVRDRDKVLLPLKGEDGYWHLD